MLLLFFIGGLIILPQKAKAAEIIPVNISIKYGQTEAREIVDMINEARTNREYTWYWNMDDITKKAHDELRAFMFEKVYRAEPTIAEKDKAQYIVRFLYKYFIDTPGKMPELYLTLAERFGLPVAVGDFISGMTDDYAVDLFKEITIPKGWNGVISHIRQG